MQAQLLSSICRFFSERAPRDAYIKNLNIKNKPSDYVDELRSLKVDVLDPTIDDSFLFPGKKIKEIKKVERYDNFSEDPVELYNKKYSDVEISNDFIEHFFQNSEFKDDLKVYFEVTNDDFSETNRYVFVDFSKETTINFDSFDWDLIKDLYIAHSRARHLHIKVREDSFCWVLKNNMPFEDLSIGFLCRITRVPDIYNVAFWNHFTNVYI